MPVVSVQNGNSPGGGPSSVLVSGLDNDDAVMNGQYDPVDPATYVMTSTGYTIIDVGGGYWRMVRNDVSIGQDMRYIDSGPPNAHPWLVLFTADWGDSSMPPFVTEVPA